MFLLSEKYTKNLLKTFMEKTASFKYELFHLNMKSWIHTSSVDMKRIPEKAIGFSMVFNIFLSELGYFAKDYLAFYGAVYMRKKIPPRWNVLPKWGEYRPGFIWENTLRRKWLNPINPVSVNTKAKICLSFSLTFACFVRRKGCTFRLCKICNLQNS